MKIIILDRDGVINYDSDYYIKSPAEWLPIPGSLQAVAELNRAGFTIVIATNQSGVARGLYSVEVLNQIHDKLAKELAIYGGAIQEFFFCPHHPDEKCNCRKPKRGLFLQIQEKYHISDFSDIYFIGDSWTDMQVGLEVGCKPLLVLTGNGEKTLANHPEFAHLPRFNDLAEAVRYILNQEQK